MQVAYASVRFVALQVMLHWATTRVLEAAKAADTCGGVKDVNEWLH